MNKLQQRSAASLARDLKAANDEAQNYLDELHQLRAENKELKSKLDGYSRIADIICIMYGWGKK